jgi:hypothetical protein
MTGWRRDVNTLELVGLTSILLQTHVIFDELMHTLSFH